jgi:hypothetical protein
VGLVVDGQGRGVEGGGVRLLLLGGGVGRWRRREEEGKEEEVEFFVFFEGWPSNRSREKARDGKRSFLPLFLSSPPSIVDAPSCCGRSCQTRGLRVSKKKERKKGSRWEKGDAQKREREQ